MSQTWFGKYEFYLKKKLRFIRLGESRVVSLFQYLSIQPLFFDTSSSVYGSEVSS